MKVIKIKSMNVWEIRDISVNEVLVDNLTYEEMLQYFEIYKMFFGKDVVRAFCKKVEVIKTTTTTYKEEYIDYFGELQEMGNLI